MMRPTHSENGGAVQLELPSVTASTLTSDEDILTMDSHSRSAALMKGTAYIDPTISNSSYRSSYLRSCFSVRNFCFVVQFVNCVLISVLIALAVQEYPKIAQLEKQVEEDKAEIDMLEQEVKEKQEGKIQQLTQEVKQEQQFNYLAIAGIFTLLTCLISIFHISTHLRDMKQPKIQRKVVAILWMSPIYSVTSFLTLWFPSVGGWMAIIKDFYEAYCIYTFLSFLIMVLGEGSRDRAVEVLSKHADHLEQPTRCLNCAYHPPPGTSDHAKANAIITECQIYGMQFTFLRPLTTIIAVLIYGGEYGGGSKAETSSDDMDRTNGGSDQDGSNGNADTSTDADEDSTPNDEARGDNDTADTTELTASQANNTGTRSLQSGSITRGNSTSSVVPTATTPDGGTWIPSPAPIEGSFGASFAPTIVSSVVGTLVPTIAAGINNTIPATPETMAPTPEMASDLMESTKAYFKSPRFFLAMVVNVSVFFAFTGLIKFYHAVREDLAWIRPWPKFLTIKGVVFLTFWQGLAITISVVALAEPSEKDAASVRAHQYQNILICVEMLLFSITHWCVFPAEEWQPNYQPKQMENPGLGIKDFVDDVGHIYKNRSARTRRSRRRISRRKKGSKGSKNYGGLYHQGAVHGSGSNSFESDGDSDDNRVLDDSISDDSIVRDQAVTFGELPLPGGVSSPGPRDRSMSDGTGGGFKADDELDSDIEIL